MWQKLRARTLNWEGRSVARAPPYVALNVCCVDVQTLRPVISGSMFAGSGSIVAGRGSMVAVRGSRFFVGGGSRFTVLRGWRFAGRGSRSRCSGATLSSRGTSVTQTFGRCGTSPVSSVTRRRLTSFPTFSLCRSTRVVEGLAWERTPALHMGHSQRV